MHAGIDLGGTKIEMVVLNAAGAVRHRRRVSSPQGDYGVTLRTLTDLVDDAEDRCGKLTSVGVGAPGSTIVESGLMKNCNSVWLNDRPLPADLAARLQRPVAVANDADCFALSEATDGAGAGADGVFGVILGTGVGGGVVVRGRALVGANGIAGEWGHNPLDVTRGLAEAEREQAASWPARRCYCGRSNCVETWLSGPGLATTAQALGCAAPDAHGVARAAEAGDPAARRALDLYARQLATALAVVVNVLDPQVIVLGGGVSNIKSLYTVVPQHWGDAVFSDRVRTRLLAPRFGDASGVRGAAWLGAREASA